MHRNGRLSGWVLIGACLRRSDADGMFKKMMTKNIKKKGKKVTMKRYHILKFQQPSIHYWDNKLTSRFRGGYLTSPYDIIHDINVHLPL